MAKKQKSKLLAMALCASVMTGIYASPVFAGSVDSITGDSNGIHFNFGYEMDGSTSVNSGTINGSDGLYTTGPYGNSSGSANVKIVGKFTIQSQELINALENKTFQNLTVNNLNTTTLTVNGETVDLSQFADVDLSNVAGIERSTGATTPGTGTTTIEGVLSVDGTTGEIYNAGSTFGVDADGNVSAASVTTSGDVSTGKYTLNTVGNNTQKISFDGTNTVVDGKLVAEKFGNANDSFWVTKDGAISAANDKFYVGTSGEVKAANGNFEIKNNGNVVLRDGATVDGVDVSELSTSVEGTATDLKDLNHKTQNINMEGTNEYTTMFDGNVMASGTIGNGRFMATNDGNVIGNVFTGSNFVTNDGADLNEIAQNTSGISKTAADTKVEGVGFYKGRMDADAVVTDELTVNGVSNLGGVRIDNGSIVANNLSYIGGVELNKGLVDGVDVSELSTTVGETNKNVAGIVRDGEGAPGEGVTTIEGATSFDANGMNVGNSAVVANIDGSFSAANGAFDVAADGTLTISNANYPLEDKTEIGAGYITMGDTNINGFGIETPYIEAQSAEIGGVEIDGGLVDGVDVSEIGAAFDDNGKLGGIKRIDSDNDGDLDTTIIENSLSANVSKVNMFGDTGLDFTYGIVPNGEAGVNVTGNMHFMSGSDVTFNYDGTKYENKSYSLNDLVDGINDLNGRVDVLEEKTQNITPSVPDQSGDPNVPPTTAGETGIVGDVTVGGDLTVNGGITADKDSTIGDVGLAGGKVTATEGTFGQTVINNDGVTVGENGTSIKHDEITVGDGGYIGGGDVVSGNDVSLNETAGRVDALEQGVSDLSSRVGELEDRIDKVGAMAAAIANLRTMGYDPAAPTEVAVGLGQYRDETGAALGLFHYPNRDFMLSLSVSTSGDEVMGGIGATWKFGRKSPEKVAEIKKAQAEADVRRAEAQKLAKAEELKAAAKEAKIKAQMERHAKLAAERAAEAEAK